MLTHISSRIRGILIRAVCLISVPLQNNIWIQMLGYQRKNKVGNLRETDRNLISNNVCALAWNLHFGQKFEHEIWHKKSKEKLYWFDNDVQTSAFLYQINLWENSRCLLTVRHFVHYAKQWKIQRHITYHSFHELQELQPKCCWSSFWV